MTLALIVFVGAYALVAGARIPGSRIDRPGGALVGAVAMVLLGIVPPGAAMREAINHETILLLLGMMIVSAHLDQAGAFRWASWFTLTRVRSPRRLAMALVFVAGTLSAFLVNDTICLMFTPLVVQLARDARIRPLPLLLALAFGANAGSVATLTGNPQNMLIGTLSGIGYARFTAVLALPAVAGLGVVAAYVLVAFRSDLGDGAIETARLERPAVDARLTTWSLVTLAGTVVAFLSGASLAWTSMLAASVLLVGAGAAPREIFARIDFVLLTFFAALFVIVDGVGRAGVATAMFDRLAPLLGTTPASQVVGFGAFTVLASQVVSNVPFVLLAGQWMPRFADPTLMWLSTALFATFAGNLTIVGSVANMIVLEGAGADGRISFLGFLRHGAVVTVASLAAALGVLWIEYRLGWS